MALFQIVEVYRKDGIDMLLKAFEDAKYLEEITGLDKLQAEADAVLEAVDWEEEEDDM
jgi:ubiquitin-like modifier-activating enzyme ATG7